MAGSFFIDFSISSLYNNRGNDMSKRRGDLWQGSPTKEIR